MNKSIFNIYIYLALFLLTSCAYSQNTINGTIIDETTGEPISDAYVIAKWSLREGNIGGSSHIGYAKILTVQTDETGKFVLPEWYKFTVPFPFSFKYIEDPVIYAVKYGYTIGVCQFEAISWEITFYTKQSTMLDDTKNGFGTKNINLVNWLDNIDKVIENSRLKGDYEMANIRNGYKYNVRTYYDGVFRLKQINTKSIYDEQYYKMTLDQIEDINPSVVQKFKSNTN